MAHQARWTYVGVIAATRLLYQCSCGTEVRVPVGSEPPHEVHDHP